MRTILFIFVAVQSSVAATYYVATNGTDSGSGTNIASPWLTIGYAAGNSGQRAGQLTNGDTVLIRGGTYYGNKNAIDRSATVGNTGTSNAPITFAAYPGEVPIITDITNPENGIILANKSYYIFSGLTWSNIFGGAFMANVTNFTFTNCLFTQMRPDVGYTNLNYEYSCVSFGGNSQRNQFINCTVTNWGSIFTNVNSAYQYQIAGTPISFGDYGGNGTPFNAFAYYNLVQGCTFARCGHDLFQLNTGYNIIRSNIFYNDPWQPTNVLAGWMYYNYGTPRVYTNTLGWWGARITKPGGGDNDFTGLGTNYNTPDLRTVFEHNIMLYGALPPDSNAGVGIELATRLGIYRNNVIAFCQGSGIYLNHSGSAVWTTPQPTNSPAFWHWGVVTNADTTACAMSTLNCIYGNTIFGNGSLGALSTGITSPVSGLDLSTYLNANINNYIVNNIIWQNWPTNVATLIYTNEVMGTNWNGDLTTNSPMFTSTNGTGYFYNPANLPDFRLQSTSPCINAGTWLAHTVGAGSGTNMTVDNSLYFSDGNQIVTGDTIQLQGQTTTSSIVSNDWQNNVLYLSSPLTWNNNQGVSLPYSGSAPDMGAYEYTSPTLPALNISGSAAVGTLRSAQ